MANICDTDIELRCWNGPAAMKVYQTILNYESKINHDGLWEDDLAKLTGLNLKFSELNGKIIDFDINGKNVYLYAQEAWSPNLHFWQRLVDKEFNKEVQTIFYTAEEPGFEVYMTNNPNMVGSYVVDTKDGDVEYFEVDEKPEVIKLLCELLIKNQLRYEKDVRELISISKISPEFINEMGLAELAAKYHIATVHKFKFYSMVDSLSD